MVKDNEIREFIKYCFDQKLSALDMCRFLSATSKAEREDEIVRQTLKILGIDESQYDIEHDDPPDCRVLTEHGPFLFEVTNSERQDRKIHLEYKKRAENCENAEVFLRKVLSGEERLSEANFEKLKERILFFEGDGKGSVKSPLETEEVIAAVANRLEGKLSKYGGHKNQNSPKWDALVYVNQSVELTDIKGSFSEIVSRFPVFDVWRSVTALIAWPFVLVISANEGAPGFLKTKVGVLHSSRTLD